MAVKTKKKKKAGKKTTRSFRPLLKEIADFLNVGDDEAGKLWYVLSALRGPDVNPEDSIDIKYATTGVIRHHIGLTNPRFNLADVVADKPASAGVRPTTYENMGWHFSGHVQNAFIALGLKWNEVNQ